MDGSHLQCGYPVLCYHAPTAPPPGTSVLFLTIQPSATSTLRLARPGNTTERASQPQLSLVIFCYLRYRSSECTITHMRSGDIKLSTAEVRRNTVISSAIAVFSRAGFLGTPIAEVARHAKISTAYVFKLFPRKEELFVAALDHCFELIVAALAKGADECLDQTPDALLFAMGGAYALLIADRKLLLLQIHAQSASDIPEIAKAFRHGLKSVVLFVKERTNAADDLVQRFMAYGQLCHLITTAELDKDQSPWAAILSTGFRHP